VTQAPPKRERKAEGETRKTLSRELGELLIQLSIGVHRFGMYPPGHPSLEPVAENVLARLDDVFRDQESLTIGVAQDQLVIEGVATERTHPVLSDLAARLHDEQLGALTFRSGVTVPEIEGLLQTLSREGKRREEDEPLGALPEDELPSWERVRVYPVGYERLRLDEGEDAGDPEGDRLTQLWVGLAQAAMATDEPLSDREAGKVDEVAETIDGHRREAAYDQVIVGYLLQLAEELKTSSGADAARIKERVSTLIRELEPDTLERLVELGGDEDQRKNFVLDANESLAVDAVIKVLQAAASASEQTISNSLTRLLTKLSKHATEGASRVRAQADTALRDNVEELISEWVLDDPNPDQYTQVLDSLARSNPLFRGDDDAGEDGGDGLAGAERLVKMALEVDATGPTLEAAVNELISTGRLSTLMTLVSGAPAESDAARRIRGYVTRPSRLRGLLSGDDVEKRTLRTLVDEIGDEAVDPLLDALVESDSRAVRRKVFDVLAGMEESIGPGVVSRLRDSRWYVLRNMLALVQRLERTPEGFDPLEFLRHDDRRVRREAFPLAVRKRDTRERALALALADDDERLVRMALLELREGFPDTLVPTVVNRVVEGDHPEDLRAVALRTLKGTRARLARECLVGVAEGGRTLLGRTKVADRSPTVLAALEALAETWPDEDEVAPVLEAARDSKDPEIRAAARAPSAGSP